MGRFKCCNGCKPPKRTGICHATCKAYLAEVAANEEDKRIRKSMQMKNDEIYAYTKYSQDRQLHERRNGCNYNSGNKA